VAYLPSFHGLHHLITTFKYPRFSRKRIFSEFFWTVVARIRVPNPLLKSPLVRHHNVGERREPRGHWQPLTSVWRPMATETPLAENHAGSIPVARYFS
jgi:hypothetical protein